MSRAASRKAIHMALVSALCAAGLSKRIGYYNVGRPHSALTGRTPNEAYGANEAERLAA